MDITMKIVLKEGHSSCAVEETSAFMVPLHLVLSLGKGDFPLTQIGQSDGEEMRQKSKTVGITGVPSYWWTDNSPEIQFWPIASGDFNIKLVGRMHYDQPEL